MRPTPVLRLLAGLAALAVGACHAHGQTSAQEGAAGGGAGGGHAAAFMAKIDKEPGVIALPDGLAYRIVRSGPASGPTAAAGDEVKVNYEGKLPDGSVFDSSYKSGEPVVFTVGALVPGWNEALTLMRPGDEWILYVPPSLGYGPEGRGPIPPDTVMIFKLELLGVLKNSGRPALG